MKTKFLIAGLFLLFLAAVLSLAGRFGASLSPTLTATIRWLAIAAFTAYAFLKRSLTAWILVAMLFGAEIGYDAPHFAGSLRIFAQIFLQMIKAQAIDGKAVVYPHRPCSEIRTVKAWTARDERAFLQGA